MIERFFNLLTAIFDVISELLNYVFERLRGEIYALFLGGLMLSFGGDIIHDGSGHLWIGTLGAFLMVSGVQAILWSLGIRNELFGTAPDRLPTAPARSESLARYVEAKNNATKEEAELSRQTDERIKDLVLQMQEIQMELMQLERMREHP